MIVFVAEAGAPAEEAGVTVHPAGSASAPQWSFDASEKNEPLQLMVAPVQNPEGAHVTCVDGAMHAVHIVGSADARSAVATASSFAATT